MNETAIPDSSVIADAMLTCARETLRTQMGAPYPVAKTPVLRFASYFANEAPEGEKPRYAEVGQEFAGDADVFPLYFGPANPLSIDSAPRVSPERISELWNSMPGGCAGFMKQWGYYQFAQAVEDEVRATLLAAVPLVAPVVSEGQGGA